MAQALTTRSGSSDKVVAIHAAGRVFTLPIAVVRDAVALGTVALVPFAPAKVRGLINVGGAVSTVIDLRAALGLAPKPPAHDVGVTVEHDGHLYTLLVDQVDGVAAPAAAAKAEPLDLAAVVGP